MRAAGLKRFSSVDRRSVLAGLTAVAAAGGNLLAIAKARAATPGDPVVETTAGKVRGERAEGAGLKFLCVPYDASTAGTGRSGGGEDAQKVATAMSSAWVAFAHTGDPGTRSLPWPAYSAGRCEMMLFDQTSKASPDPVREARSFRDEVAATS